MEKSAMDDLVKELEKAISLSVYAKFEKEEWLAVKAYTIGDIIHKFKEAKEKAKPTAPASLIKELLEYVCECDAKEVMPTCSMIAHIASRYQPDESLAELLEKLIALRYASTTIKTWRDFEYWILRYEKIISDFTPKDGKGGK